MKEPHATKKYVRMHQSAVSRAYAKNKEKVRGTDTSEQSSPQDLRGLKPGREIDPSNLEPPDECLVSILSPHSFEAEQFRQLRYAVEHMRQDNGLRVVGIVSPSSRDGKSVISTNLAGALAQSPEVRVLLVEADLRQPSLSLLLGLGTQRRAGLVDAVLDTKHTLSDVVLNIGAFNLAVLLAGSPTNNPYEILRSSRFQALLNDARSNYDFVVVDTPPVLLCPDSRLIEDRVDGFIVVVSANKTPRKLVDDTLGELAEEKVLGLVFNKYQHLGRYSSYYSSYYSSFCSGAAQSRRTHGTSGMTSVRDE
jgi:capsular exopolysaccharide synthesis family protein